MGKVEVGFAKGKSMSVGIDVHKRDWVVTVLCQGEEEYHAQRRRSIIVYHGVRFIAAQTQAERRSAART